ncbi:MAG: hypothetical protein M1363_06015 [Gammaproteobacteria bacterium]|nr:hypothetical protein [Gammaproteobacteria bacterium]
MLRCWGVERMDARAEPTGMYLRRPQQGICHGPQEPGVSAMVNVITA